MNDVKPSPTGEAQEVKVKVRINQNGVILISSAQMLEKKDPLEEQNGVNENEPQTPTEPTQDGQTPAGEAMETQDVSKSFFPTLQTLTPCIFTIVLITPLVVSHKLEDDHPADKNSLIVFSSLFLSFFKTKQKKNLPFDHNYASL